MAGRCRRGAAATVAGLALAGFLMSVAAAVEQAVSVVGSSTTVEAAAQQPDWYVRT